MDDDNNRSATPELTFKAITKERYDEMLNLLFPLAWDLRKGFLLCEPMESRVCRVTGQYRDTYNAFVKRGGSYFESLTSITIPEWRAFDASTLKIA